MKVRHLKRLKPRPRRWLWLYDFETVTGRSPCSFHRIQDVPKIFRERPYQESFLVQMDFADLEARVIAKRNQFAFNYGIRP